MKSSTLKTSLLPSSSIPPSNQASTSTSSSSIPPSPSSSQTPHSHPHTPFLTSNFKRELSVEEIKSPSKFDIPDSLLISILTFSFFKFIKYKRFRIILKGIGTFIALVLYQHAVYDICWFYINDTIYAIYALFLLFGSILLLVLSRSLESLVQYQPENDEQNFTISIINETGYLCGYIDRDLKSCCKVDCTFYIGNYHFYILRFIRYNLNAILITTCWVGSDSSFEILTQRIMNRHDAPRLALDIFLLILSNLLLLYCGQLSGQLGVFGDQHAVESIYDTTGSLILETNSQAENGSASNSPTANGNYNPPLLSPFSTSNPGQKEELSFDERLTERGSSLYERGKMEMSLHFKVTLTLLGLLMYWFCLWDLCWNYPREALIRTVYESRDDDVDSVDSYSRRHVSPKVEIYLMLIGILYCIASSIVLILTGGLYSFIHTETDETREVHRQTLTRFQKILRRWGINWDENFDSLSIPIGNKLFMPIRLIEYNILGAFGVIAWIGFDTIITSLENLFVYYYILSPIARYTLDVVEIIIAIILLTRLQQFGNQFGGRDNLAEKHEIVSVDGAFHSPSSSDVIDDKERGW